MEGSPAYAGDPSFSIVFLYFSFGCRMIVNNKLFEVRSLNYNVVIADDEYPIRYGLEKSIEWEKHGFAVVGTAEDGIGALDIIRDNRVHLLVTDIRMPEMDGIELIRNVKAVSPDTKIIILSGYGEFQYTQKAIEYGVFAYLLKPLKDSEIYAALEHVRETLDRQEAVYSGVKAKSEEEDFIQKLLFGEDEVTDLNEATESARLLIHEEYVCTALLSLDNIDRKRLKTVVPEWKKYWKSRGGAAEYDNGVFGILFSSKDKLSERWMESELKLFQNRILEDVPEFNPTGAGLSAGIGSIYSGYENIRKSVHEAEMALQIKFFFPAASLIHYKDISSKMVENIDRFMLKQISAEIIEMVIKGEQYAAVPKTRQLFAQMLCGGYCMPNLIIIKCLEIYLNIANRIESMKLDSGFLVERTIYSELSRCGNLEELVKTFTKQLTDLAAAVGDSLNKTDNSVCMGIMKYIDENYETRITLKTIADKYSFNTTYLSSYFKENTGVNIFEYLLKVRIENAKKLLKNSNLQINEISEKVGFSEYRYFCRTFKKEVGIPPQQYRIKCYV